MKTEQRILSVNTADDGELRITIPDDAKITFGPAVPFSGKGAGYTPNREYALRIYRGSKENLLAVFTGVKQFRETSIKVEKLVIREAGQSIWKSDEHGFSTNQEVKRNRKYIDLARIGDGSNVD